MSAEKRKLPGKTTYSGRRRSVTRKSGFRSARGVTGGEYEIEKVWSHYVDKKTPLIITFIVPQELGKLSGFGFWFTSTFEVDIAVKQSSIMKITQNANTYPDWGKVGSIWEGQESKDLTIEISITSNLKNQVAVYSPVSGLVTHKYLEAAIDAKPSLISNMYQFAPEAIFLKKTGQVTLSSSSTEKTFDLYRKSCNRCSRYLPINIANERVHLSFTNHCVAAHRRPCSHSGFGKLREHNGSKVLTLDFGYQLECRFCKKFEVNAAHNPKRTPGQMKEDGARRRNIELLLAELYGGSDQLRFRHENGGLELADYIWEKFGKKCFNCKNPIASAREMDLDHTRPLALLWPLDKTATCLCGDCNTLKRDKAPVDFYTKPQIQELSKLSGLSVTELQNPNPNVSVLDLLVERMDWFYVEFLRKPELLREREGKIVAELLVKAIQKVAGIMGSDYPNFIEEYKNRNHNSG